MIELKVEEYCQNCEAFYPIIGGKSACKGDTGEVICYTIVECDKRQECMEIYKWINKWIGRSLKERKDDEY